MLPRMSTRRPALAVLLAVLLGVAGSPADLLAYQKFGFRINGRVIELKWPTASPVRYFVSDSGASGVSAGQLRDAIERAFAAWQGVPTSTIGFSFGGFVSASPLDEDGMSTLGFESAPELERVLGSTSFLIDTTDGRIVEADIFFNSTFEWSVASGGESGRFDLESIAVHEIGHFLGLGHSALGETEVVASGGRRVLGAGAVMFPIAFAAGNVEGRTLEADDIAGASDLYPDREFTRERGSISGRVTRNGRGVFGAHVVAFNPATNQLVGGFTLNDDGEFVIAGLEPGPHILRVEPLDDGDLDSFFDDTSDVDVDFRVTYAPRMVVAPRGGNSERVEIEVTAK